MIYKRYLAFAFFMIFSMASLAAETDVVGMHGRGGNPAYGGEGFAFEQYDDGFIIAYWYTYDVAGNQVWLIGTGTVENNHVDLEMIRTEGGMMASQQNPGSVTEEPWGIVSLDLISCAEIDMIFEGNDGTLGGYKLQRIINESLAGSPCLLIEPEPAPEPEPDFKLQQLHATGAWNDAPIPLIGPVVINKTYTGNDGSRRSTHMQFRVIVQNGEHTVLNLSARDASGRTSPAIVGAFEGQTITADSPAVFRLVSDLTNNLTVIQDYQIELRDIGVLLALEVHLTTN